MWKLSNINIFIFLFCFVFVSCKLDNIELENDEWSPEIISPLINSTLTIGNLIPEQGPVEYDDDNFIRLGIREDSLYSLTADAFVNIPDEINFEEQFMLSELDIDDFSETYFISLEDIVHEASNSGNFALEFLIFQLFGDNDGDGQVDIPSPFYADITGSIFNNLNETVFSSEDLSVTVDEFKAIDFNTGLLQVEVANTLPLTLASIELEISTTGSTDPVGTLVVNDLAPNSTYVISLDLEDQIVSNEINLNIIDFAFEPVGVMPLSVTPESGLDINFSITDINVNSITMPLNGQEFDVGNQYFELNLAEDADHRIHTVRLLNGEINYSLTSSLDCSIIAQFGIPSAIDANGVTFISDEIILDNNTEGTIDISGLEVDLTSNPDQSYNFIPLSSKITILSEDDVTLDQSDYLDVSFSFSDLELGYIDGYFDTYTVDLGGDVVDLDLSLFEDFDSGLKLEDPSLTINLSNSLGIGANVLGKLEAYSEEGEMAFFEIDSIIDRPFFEGEEVNMSWVYNKDVIGDIIELPPRTFEYQAAATIISDGNLNFVTNESALLLGVALDFPLSVNAANISLRDTIVLDQIEYDDISRIERLILHYNFINGFPLGTEFNLVLRDSISNDGENLDTLNFVGLNTDDNLIQPASVNELGYVLAPTLTSGAVPLSSLEISNFLNSNQIVIDVTLSSSNYIQEDQYVKIYSDHECILKVGVETKVKLN